jgi:hypothetical protein
VADCVNSEYVRSPLEQFSKYVDNKYRYINLICGVDEPSVATCFLVVIFGNKALSASSSVPLPGSLLRITTFV